MPTADPTPTSRIVGITVPLFSLRTRASWGIGEIGDLPVAAAWLAPYGIRLIQILPLGEIGQSESSPYSALSAFGIDPMYLSMHALEDLATDAVREALGGDLGVALLERAKAAPRVEYDLVRFVKNRALRAAYARFCLLPADALRLAAFEAFCAREAFWLADLALYRALKNAHGGRAWWQWSDGLVSRESVAMTEAARAVADEVRYYRYLQWLAVEQWSATRAELKKLGVEVMGDLPFMVGRDSADVWSHPGEFRSDMEVGVPPDQFDPDGQDWGLPPYRWEAMHANDFAWLRRRASAAAALYDRFRIDHLVGFCRTYMRPRPTRDEAGKLVPGVFHPAEQPEQERHALLVLRAMITAASEYRSMLVAEDLGIVPPWVRVMLGELGVPGYRVMIWEKHDEDFIDPAHYPPRSVACFGTHDTDPVSAWWETRDAVERIAVCALPTMVAHAIEPTEAFGPRVHAALLATLLASPSELVLLLVQDALGIADRVNVPGTVGPKNWSFRLSEPIEELRQRDAVRAALERVRLAVTEAGRETE